MTNFLDYLKESPDCLYIYNLNETIYGLPNKEKYVVVVKDDWVCPEDWIGFDTEIFRIFYLQQWFNRITSGDIIGWECACLNKKYVIKEHVKLLMTTNPLQLRKCVDAILKSIDYDPKDLVRNIKFSVQIINNHKIVNYKDGLDDIITIDNISDKEDIDKIINKHYSVLKSLTDGMVKQEIIEKCYKNSISKC